MTNCIQGTEGVVAAYAYEILGHWRDSKDCNSVKMGVMGKRVKEWEMGLWRYGVVGHASYWSISGWQPDHRVPQ